jgi:hypothetical protein
VTPEQTAHEIAMAVVDVPARFMSAPATLARGEELGLRGFDFYFAGRGGALGDVPADVVVAAMVFFAPHVVVRAWERTADALPRRQAAEEFAACGHAWAREHFSPGPDYARLAALLGRVVAGAAVAGAPLFAGWRAMTEPSDDTSLVQHRLNVLRELRGGLHAAAILTVGLTPHEAVALRTPDRVSAFGWKEPHPEPEPLRDRWQLAEARTDRMVGKHFGVLDDTERTELVDLAAAARAAVPPR